MQNRSPKYGNMLTTQPVYIENMFNGRAILVHCSCNFARISALGFHILVQFTEFAKQPHKNIISPKFLNFCKSCEHQQKQLSQGKPGTINEWVIILC